MYQRIETERKRLLLSRKDLASRLGVSARVYTSWSKKGRLPCAALMLMAQMFDVSTDALLGHVLNRSACARPQKTLWGTRRFWQAKRKTCKGNGELMNAKRRRGKAHEIA